MSDQATRLLSRIAKDRDIDYVARRGITAEMFLDPESKDVFRYITRHSDKYSEVPTARALKDEFPSLRLVKVDDAIEVVTDSFLADWRWRKVYAMVDQLTSMAKPKNVEDMVTVCTKTMEELAGGLGDVNRVDIMSDPEARYDEYLVRESRPGGLLGISTGFPTMDKATLGLQPGQLVTIVATPKAGKSQLALKMAHAVHGAGYRVAFQSFEMTHKELEKRYDALAYRLSHNRLMNGDLVQKEKDRYIKGLKAAKGAHPFFLADSNSGMTVSALAAEASLTKPDVLFVDGVYLMTDETTGERGTPQALTNITRSLKRLAQRLNIPVVITTQVLTWKQRKGKIDPNSIGYSSSFYQDSDVIFGLEKGEDENDGSRLLKIVASRNCGPAEVDLDWDWDGGIFEEATAAPVPVGFSYGAP